MADDQQQDDGGLVTRERRKRPEFVVGIGASAGGLESLQRFFGNVGEPAGMTFVVVQHLSPDFESLMDELLARHTSLPVVKVSDGMEVEAGHIYLIPPGKDMTIGAGRLRLTDRSPRDKLSLPIDNFLRSLAADVGAGSIAVILSGTGSDGSRGALAVAERGGLVLAESDASAKFHGMPRSVMDAGCVDRVLDAEEMGEALRRYLEVPTAARRLVEPDGGASGDLASLLELLRGRSGIDFSSYKPATVARRVNRRLLLHHNDALAEYVEQVRNDTDELDALIRDLLIGVTRFFRDTEAYKRVAALIDEHIGKLSVDETFRIWSAGCATGEEIYSLTMLANEAFRRRGQPPRVKAFATDVHEGSLRQAGSGRYPMQAMENVPEDLRERWFEQVGESWQAKSELRGQIVFARHDMLKDAPFTRINLLACRNLLIYFSRPAQRKALTFCHFGLRTDGILFLGPSEAPLGLEDEFSVVDSRWKLFRKRRDVRLLPNPDLVPFTPSRPGPAARAERDTDLAGQARKLLLDRFGPPALLVGPDGRLIHAFGGAAEYIRHRDGEVSLAVLDLLGDDLRFAVSATLQRVRKHGEPAGFRGVELADGQVVDVEVSMLHPDADSVSPVLIVLKPVDADRQGPLRNQFSGSDVPDLAVERIADLEDELGQTRENLQTALEEMETSNEELQASNEELMAANEELQGTNEELHSVNEELYSVNAEYQSKIEELKEVTSDLNQLLDTAQVHTLFLDRELRIRRFTAGMGRLFDLLPQDEGRYLTTFTHRLKAREIHDRLRTVRDTDQGFESTVEAEDGRSFLMRIVPYRRGDRSEGVLLTLLDITELQRATSARDRLASVIDATSDFIGMASPEGLLLTLNPGGRELIGYGAEEDLPDEIAACHPDWAWEIVSATGIPTARERGRWSGRTAVKRRDGSEVPVSQIIIAHRDSESDDVAYYSTIIRDLTDEVAMMESLQEADERKNEFIAMLAHELRNPLQAIRVSLDLVNDTGATHLERASRIIGHQVEQLRRLVDDLMDVSRITRGKISLKREPMDLTALLREQFDGTGRCMDDRHELDVELPDEPVWIDGDSARVEQIVGNLLTNACRYSPGGTRVRLELTADDEDTRLSVIDQGVGLTPEDIEAIFEPFVQRAGGQRSGLGLGLTLIRKLMLLHGGEVTATSAGQEQGSCFTVTFPRIDAAPGVASTETRERERSLDLRVLAVDDNRQALDSLVRLLELRGCTVHSAERGSTAIQLASEHELDAAVIDIGLPDTTGHQVAEALRAAHGDRLRLVAVTGYGQQEVRERALEAGFDDFLVKPVGVRPLEDALVSPEAPDDAPEESPGEG